MTVTLCRCTSISLHTASFSLLVPLKMSRIWLTHVFPHVQTVKGAAGSANQAAKDAYNGGAANAAHVRAPSRAFHLCAAVHMSFQQCLFRGRPHIHSDLR